MDKFFYRLTLQTIIKGVLTAFISFFVTGIVYTLFTTVLQPVSAKFDYWLQAGVFCVVTVITCFMIITVKDGYSTTDTTTYSVGRFWANRVNKGKKVRWFTVELMMLPILAAALGLAYLFYRDHGAVLELYDAFYAAESISKSAAQEFFIGNFPHFAKLVLAIFLFAQWKHVRNFAKEGRCPHCKAAFSLGSHGTSKSWTDISSKITQKSKTTVVGANYNVITEDGEEVSRTKTSDIYGKTYQNYQTDTKTTYYSFDCRCAFCNHLTTKTDVHSTYTTKKVP